MALTSFRGSRLMTSTQPGPPDPMKMANQPALQRSTGTVWIVCGGLFMLASFVAFGAMILGGSGASTPLAVTICLLVVALYVVLVMMRFVIGQERLRLRLRVMAICMLTMAGLSLIGIWVCALIETAAISGVSS